MKKTRIQEVRQFEEKTLNGIDSSKPSFHVVTPIGWLNDPNGFSIFRDECHLFFQYHPYDTKWGPMHWGHCTTKDFVKWQYLPAALAPDQSYDQNGCFSGSAIEKDNQHILIYTGVDVEKDSEGTEKVEQVQCVASGDGLNYKKWDNNPVVTPDLITEPVSKADFRDPKVWEHEGTYYMVVGCCDNQKMGRIGLFSSEDLSEWNYKGMLARNDGAYGRMWECPDFFEVDETAVLIISPQDMRAKDLEFHNGNGTIYFAGEFDYQTCEFQHAEARVIDYGLDFYAPQTTVTKDGRRIMIGWMQSWDSKLMPEDFSWNGMMTLPRELHIKERKLIQTPIRELENYYTNHVAYSQIELKDTMELQGISGRQLNLEIEILDGEYHTFELQFAKNEDYSVSCKYESATGILSFDRTNSNIRRDVVCERKMKVSQAGCKVKIRMILDKYSAEIFVNNGEQVMTSVFVIPQEAEKIEFIVEGSLMANIVQNKIQIEA